MPAEALALLVRRGDAYEPTEWARGYWDPTTINGGVIAGLISRVLEASFGEPDLQFARLTVDLFRPAPLAPLSVSTALVRAGNRLRAVEAVVSCAGREVARGHGVLLRRSEEPPGNSGHRSDLRPPFSTRRVLPAPWRTPRFGKPERPRGPPSRR